MHQQRVAYMVPREPIRGSHNDRRTIDPEVVPRRQAVIEVTRNSMSDIGEVEVVGRFYVTSDSDPSKLAERFGSQYGLNGDQKKRLREKLCVSINQL